MVYIAGPMSGRPGHNLETFDRVASEWRARGHYVVSPAETTRTTFACLFGRAFDPEQDVSLLEYRYFLPADITSAMASQALVLLDGWQASQGARIEVAVCLLLDKEFYDEHGGRLTPKVQTVA